MEIRDWKLGRSGRLSWVIAAGLLLLLLVLMPLGWWRNGGTGPQVQVPMFYDAHYLFPRPWTQAQSVPGVPDPAPVALYGDNAISQSFRVETENAGMVSLWLDGPEGTAVALSLTAPDGTIYAAEIRLDDTPHQYNFQFPRTSAAVGEEMTLRLMAAEAVPSAPVVVHTVGGDRLGAAVRLNEFIRPGNLVLQTYARGLPGRWWLDAIVAQLLPAVFRLRLQQYKPLKGAIFPLLLLTVGGLTLLFLLLARPGKRPFLPALGWFTVVILGSFLGWQLLDGRVRLVPDSVVLQPAAQALPIAHIANGTPRLVDDLALTLWTARRDPEPRFVFYDLVAGYPALRVPADSQLVFERLLPRNGRLHAGILAQGDGALRYRVLWQDVVLVEDTVAAGDDIVWLDVDLGPFAGQAGALHLVTAAEAGTPEGVWLMPQLLAETDWLLTALSETAVPVDAIFNEQVALAGYEVQSQGDQMQVTLYWQALTPLEAYATVFVHALDANQNILAQSDAQPVQNSYPLPLWPPGVVVADTHILPPTDVTQLGVGLYDPVTFVNWSLVDGGVTVANGRLLLPIVEPVP
ncbi:MAG: hypothetical protein H6664_13300 [Ardenticatenaceae bacterium]|nr:hypothetical protein [Ardenticatenaceae bacterium]MCB9005346.1 hypothetical protein [Ardenticatenaceae bacterium]